MVSDKEESNMDRVEKAKQLFREGANCSQAVFGAFCDEFGIGPTDGMRMVSGFGGGVGRLREVCGAVSGMVMVENLRHGPYGLDKKDKDAHYARVRALADKFKAETGSIVCRELLNIPAGTPQDTVSEERTAAYYRKRPCVELVALAARILVEDQDRESNTNG